MHPGDVKPLMYPGVVTCLSTLGKVRCPHPPCCHLQKLADTLDGVIDTMLPFAESG